MKPGECFNPTQEALRQEWLVKIRRLQKGLELVKNQDGVYAQDLRRCLRMYEAIMAAIEAG